jgi:hypothetical protein
MPQQRLQVIPLDVFAQGIQNHRKKRRRNAAAVKVDTGKTARQAKTQAKPRKVIQPVTALLYQSALANQQEQAEAKRLQKAKPQQIIQPVTALQFLSALAQQQVAPVAKPGHKSAPGKAAVSHALVVTQSPPQQSPAKPKRTRKPAARKPAVPQAPVIVQPLPVQRTPSLWWRLYCGIFYGIRLVGLPLNFLFGGLMGFVLAMLFLLPQTFFAVMLFLFPTIFPIEHPREPIIITALLLLAYTLTAYQHRGAVKHHNKYERDEIRGLPIICLHSLYLLAWFLAAKVFL